MLGQMIFRDSIYALSSGRLPAGVAVVRLSGPHVRTALHKLTGSVPEPRVMRLCTVHDAEGALLDQGLSVFFPGPSSFTGEDSCEFHLHGGRAVVAALLDAIGGLEAFRHAEAGEFSRRAFLNGKIDLTGAEALSDLVSSETEAQRRFALLNASGAQAGLYGDWRRRIIHARAMIEAELDFADQDDVPGSVSGQIWSDVNAMMAEMDRHVASYRRAEIIRDGYKVVIIGAPNAGKSSLLNALAGRDVAIVTDEPGTTRDLVEVALDLDGIKVMVVDTAGIREAAGARVEAIGIERALQSAEAADLVLNVEDMALGEQGRAERTGAHDQLLVGTKRDLAPDADLAEPAYDFTTSTKTGVGLSELLEAISKRAAAAAGHVGDILPSRLRHVELLRQCRAELARAAGHPNSALELAAEDLRKASDSLGRIVGAVDVEDLLDTIFSSFCIGK
jgi:tRNA modification GTPase